MSTNIATLRNGIYASLTTCGPYSSTQVSSCDYRAIEQSSGCAIIFHYEGEDIDPITFNGADGTPTELINSTFGGECYIQFTGDTKKFLGDVYQARDDLKATFAKTYSLLGSACFAWVSRFKFNIDEGYNLGGRDWGLLEFTISVRDM